MISNDTLLKLFIALAWWSAAWSFAWTGIIFYIGYRFGLRSKGTTDA